MSEIIRRPDFVGGGITAEEKTRLDAHAQLWIKRALRTSPIEPEKITHAIKMLYSASGLKEPRVVIVPSPRVMALSGGHAAAIWHLRQDDATRVATDDATYDATDDATYVATYVATYDATRVATYDATRAATYDATRAATYDATDDATYDATYVATYDATRVATYAATYDATYDATRAATRVATYDATYDATDAATDFVSHCQQKWWRMYQGGNMWAANVAYLTAFRDVLGLSLPEHEKYKWWEQAAIHGGFRIMHEEFCMVSDFPEVLRVDSENRPHSEDGPSHRWRDGWEIFHWHGTKIPEKWITEKDKLTATEVLSCENVEQRAAGCAIIGMAKMLDSLEHKILDSHPDPQCGDLIEIKMPDLPESELYLKFFCPRNGEMMEAVNKRELETLDLHHAHAWHAGVPARLYSQPAQRS